MSKDKKLKWYNSGNVITTLIIIVILMSIICSQSFTLSKGNSFSVLYGVINHNSIYLLILVYFVLLKTYFGKKYFNYLNIFLVFIYFISTITSFLTFIQSFSLNTVLSLFLNIILLIYIFHTLLRDTHIWNDYKLERSPFNEIKNDNFYYGLVILVVFELIINLISTVVLRGLFISVFDALYLLLFGRYIYLYREFLDNIISKSNKADETVIKKKPRKRIKKVKKGEDE